MQIPKPILPQTQAPAAFLYPVIVPSWSIEILVHFV